MVNKDFLVRSSLNILVVSVYVGIAEGEAEKRVAAGYLMKSCDKYFIATKVCDEPSCDWPKVWNSVLVLLVDRLHH